MLVIASLCLCLLAALYLSAKSRLSYWSRRGVKSPPANLIFGNFQATLSLNKPPGLLLQEIYESADPDEAHVGFYVFHSPKLLLRDLELIKQLFVKDFEVFCNRCFGGESQRDAVGLLSILSARQPLWGYIKQKLTPGLTGAKLREMVPLIRERLGPMMSFLEGLECDRDGWLRLDAKDLSGRYTTDVLASLAFGISVNSFDKSDSEFYENGQGILVGDARGAALIIMFFLPGLVKFIQRFIRGPAKLLRSVLRTSMSIRETSGCKRGDLVDYLVALKNGEQRPDYPFEGDNLLAQVESIFTAGYESTSTVIAFTLYELSRHPEHEATLYQEISQVLADRELDVEALKRMTFLDQVVNEVLRLYPSLPFVDRVAERDYKLPGSGIVIEKGTAVYVSLNGLNRDPKYFERPNEFIPTRARIASPDLPSTSLSFGIGQRSCIGQRLTLVMTKIAVIGILKKYTVASETNEEASLRRLTVFTVAGVPLKLKKRK